MAQLREKQSPSEVVARILSRGRPPFKVVEFPRRDEHGEAIASVHVRLLTTAEEQVALVQARATCARYERDVGKDYKSDLNDIEHNERIIEILAIACRDAEDPSKPFFVGGPSEVREFTSDELGLLVAVYARLKEGSPRLSEMTAEEFEKLLSTLKEGVDSFPFATWPRAVMEDFLERLLRYLGPAGGASTTTMNSSLPTS